MIDQHDWKVDTFVITMLDGGEEWSAAVKCECGYRCATERTYPTADEATAAAERHARWSPFHGDL